MNLADADKLIPILQGVVNGGTLQVWDSYERRWVDATKVNIAFSLDASCYRLKPVPKKLYVLRLINNVGEVSSGIFGTYISLKQAQDSKKLFNNHNLVIETYEKVT